MSFWGSAIDASKAIHYSKRPPPKEDLPDPIFETDPNATITVTTTSTTSTTTIVASTTKSYVKPTEHLPEDHTDAEGESHNPAFPDTGNNQATTTSSSSTSSAGPSITFAPDEGIFAGMTDLLSNSYWLYGILGFIVLLGVGAGAFFWRRRRRQRAEYSTVAGDDMVMQSMLPHSSDKQRRGGTKELYDAFGEVSDEEEEYADEEMALRGRNEPVGVRYHDGFLEDDDDNNSPVTRYRDDPTPEERAREQAEVGRQPGSGSPDSTTGSWEHAQTSSSEAVNRVSQR